MPEPLTASNLKKASKLGMSLGKASHQLKRALLFSFIQKLNLNKCYRCGKEMSVDDYSLDHKQDWLDNDPALFWDLENIAFSHLSCNSLASSRNKLRKDPDRVKVCKDCPKTSRETKFVSGKNWCYGCHNRYLRERKARLKKNVLDAGASTS
jgi:hypothetical protein